MMMPVWSILLLSFIYICAIGFTVWNNMLSHTFTLFGVSVANKSKGSSSAVRLKVIFVRAMMIIFTVLNFVTPILMLKRPGTVHRFLLFNLVYAVCMIIWTVVFKARSIGKRDYEKEIREILDNTPLYTETVRIIRENRGGPAAVKTVVPCPDGIALFYRNLQSQSIDGGEPPRHDTFSDPAFDAMEAAREWEEKTKAKWSSVHTLPGADYILPGAKFGFEKLTEQDIADFCHYIAKEKLGLYTDTVTLECTYRSKYVEHISYSDGSSEDLRHKVNESGEVEIKVATML